MKTIHMNTVSASGATNLREVALWTMPLASSSTHSTRISTKACILPGTPAVARRAPSHSRNTTRRPMEMDQKSVS